MSWYRRVWNGLRPARTQRDLARELSFHVAESIEELQAAGMSAGEAASSARRQFGNLTAHVERTREMDIHQSMDAAVRNLRYAARSLRKTPAFTAAVVLTMALGIGANSAVFSAIDAVLLRPLPFPQAGRLVSLAQVNPKIPQPQLAAIRLEEWNRLNRTFQAISGYYTQDGSELSAELPEKITQAYVAPRFLQVWGVAPALGRDFTPAEEKFGGPQAILISDRLWRRRFGADPNAVGRTLRFGRLSVPIVGVMPASFQFPDRAVDTWSPSPPDAPFAQSRESTWYIAIGRLQPGVTLARARADLAAVQASLGRLYPKTDAAIKPGVQPLKEITVGGVRKSLWILFGSVSLLLLIACTNIAAMLLSRAVAREHEIAVRFSLGASRRAVAAQLLTEVFLLALAGAAAGLLLAAAASSVFRALARDLPRVDEIALDGRIVLYSLACAVAATLLCGVVPAIRGTRRDLTVPLARAGRSQVSGRNPLQFLLVGVQVALAVTLLAGAGLLLRSFQELGRVSPGFDPTRILTFHVSTTWGETADQKASAQRTDRILEAVNGLPGVEAAATAFSLPGVPAKYSIEMASVEGRAETEPKMFAEGRAVTPGYFATLRIPLLAGELCRGDVDRPAMMVNRSFAGSYLHGSQGIGLHLTQVGYTFFAPAAITGIVGDARESGLENAPRPTVYWCLGANQPGTYFLVRTHGNPQAMAETIRQRVHQLEPLRSVYGLTPLTDHISDAYAENRMRTILLTFFAATAVLLACVGLYGTLSYLVNMRQREVGLRLALGAARTRVARQFLFQGLRISLLGCAAGLVLSVLSARLLAGMLFGVTQSDKPILAGVVGIVLAVSLLASLLPAVRAARLDPIRILRDE